MKTTVLIPVIAALLLVQACSPGEEQDMQDTKIPVEVDTLALTLPEDTVTIEPIVPETEAMKRARNHVVRCTETGNNARVTTHYNKKGQSVSEVQDNGIRTTWTYNAAGLLMKEYRPGEGGHTFTYRYDDQQRLVETNKRYDDTTGMLIRYTYDSTGNLSTMVYTDIDHDKRIEETHTFYYTGQQLDSVYIDKAVPEKKYLTYYRNGDLKKEEIWLRNSDGTWALSETTGYRYYSETRLRQREAWQSYNADGKPGLSVSVTYTYNNKGDLLTKINHALGIIQQYRYEYNEKGLLEKQTITSPQSTLVTEYAYSYR